MVKVIAQTRAEHWWFRERSRDKNLKESLGCEMCSSERATRCFVGVARNQPNLTRDPLANYFAQWSVSPAIPNKDRFPDFS
jgi:hypothetical protein